MTPKDIIKITLNLVVIYIIGALILAAVYAKTSPVIYQKNEQEKQEALKKMAPEAEAIEKLGDWYPHEKHAEYYAVKKGGDVAGYIIQTFGKGYSSYINILVATDKDLRIEKIEILSHAETPGLGDEIETDSFKNQFKGKSLENIKLVKTETTEYIQAITGVTISSRAVTEDGVKNALRFLKETLEGNKQGGS
ncbi:MAG: RnfABCDGE type electron transport complex subunit G [Thermodesulfovibrionales bacterium]|nr:RnfABCDGE type electron transport complex subunit G [Thermodesulfovibrionales bacterium]